MHRCETIYIYIIIYYISRHLQLPGQSSDIGRRKGRERKRGRRWDIAEEEAEQLETNDGEPGRGFEVDNMVDTDLGDDPTFRSDRSTKLNLLREAMQRDEP